MQKRKLRHRGPVRVEFNVTPLIDVTFLLIIFFMVISNFITEESVQMIVPKLENPEVRAFEKMNRVVVNISPQRYDKTERRANHLEWDGAPLHVKIGSNYFAMDQMNQVVAMLKTAVDSGPKDEEGKSTLEVLLRADAALFYDSVQPVMAAIARAGISKVHLVSYLPDHGPDQGGRS